MTDHRLTDPTTLVASQGLGTPTTTTGSTMSTGPSGLTIESAVAGDRRSVAVRGELDLSTTAELADALAPELAEGLSALTLDLTGVGFIDSSALRTLVLSGRALAAAGCTLEIGPRSPMVARVLEMTSLDQGNDAFRVLPVED